MSRRVVRSKRALWESAAGEATDYTHTTVEDPIGEPTPEVFRFEDELALRFFDLFSELEQLTHAAVHRSQFEIDLEAQAVAEAMKSSAKHAEFFREIDYTFNLLPELRILPPSPGLFRLRETLQLAFHLPPSPVDAAVDMALRRRKTRA